MALWCRLQGNPNLQLLLDAWSVSHEEAESRILPQSEQETFDSKGHAWTKLKVAWKTWGSKKPPPVLFTCPRCRTFRKDLWSFGPLVSVRVWIGVFLTVPCKSGKLYLPILLCVRLCVLRGVSRLCKLLSGFVKLLNGNGI